MNFFELSNEKISVLLNNFVINNNIGGYLGYLADIPIFFIPVFLIFAWIYYAVKQNNEGKYNLINIFYGIVLGVIVNLIIQHYVHISRPEKFIQPILKHIPDASFPSDHATVSFAFLFGLYAYGYKKVFYVFLPFIVIMNLSRIAGGIHWFWDVIAGLVVGLLSVVLIFKFSGKLSKINNLIIKIASFFKL